MFLEGKTVLITGAGSGIGRALAIEASRRGLKLALVGRRRETLSETQHELSRPEDCIVIVADVTTSEGRERVCSQLSTAWGGLNVLVNNAGIVAAGPLSSLPDIDLERLVATNLTAPIALTRDLLPLLRAASPARVVNIGSLSGEIALPLFAAYSATKFGLRGLSNALRRELKGHGIGVTYAAPGGVRTAAAEAVAPFIEALGMRATDSPAAVAARIWKAVGRGADGVYPDGRERWFVFIERFLPALITRALAQQLEAGARGGTINGEALSLPLTRSHAPQSSDHRRVPCS